MVFSQGQTHLFVELIEFLHALDCVFYIFTLDVLQLVNGEAASFALANNTTRTTCFCCNVVAAVAQPILQTR